MPRDFEGAIVAVGGETERTLPCGCVVFGVWPVLCPEARRLEAEMRQAMRERDRVGMRLLAAQLRVHRDEEASFAEIEEITRPGGAYYVAERPVAPLSKGAAP
jgi:hypothetical protein